MRLICPNCGAQYAVDARVIPAAGRDVQCSNCGNTWFQAHPEKSVEPAKEQVAPPRAQPPREPETAPPAEPAREPGLTRPVEPDPGRDLEWRRNDAAPRDVPEPVEQPVPTPMVEQERAAEVPPPVAEAPTEAAPADSRLREVSAFRQVSEPNRVPETPDAPVADLSDVPDEAPDDFAEEDSPPVARPRRPVDDAVLAVLKEEAEREAAARKAESGGLETQGELNMEMPERAFSAPPPFGRDPARVVPGDTLPPEVAPRPERAATRRDLLPDIEEINSTLKPEDRPASQPVETAADREQRNRGRRFGMSLAFFLAGFLVLLYAQAARVADAVPQAAPALENYVATVNSGRLWLDRTLRDAVDAVQGTEG